MSVSAQCDALIQAGLGDQILLPGTNSYEDRINSWWSATARLRPRCIVQPRNSQEVAAALKALASTEGAFAVRSGGHSQWAGGSNIEDGVTIDLCHLNQISYDRDRMVASLGPAQRWGDIFPSLEAQGVMVSGARDSNVGVGGLLTGGGNSYYTGRRGFLCDSLINAEVALADGNIVNANAHCHEDLWKALKGGLSNFGIVTRFDVQAFEAGLLWGGLRVSDGSYMDQIIDALVTFTDENHKEPGTALAVGIGYQPKTAPGIFVIQLLVDTSGEANSPAFEKLKKVPELFSDIKKQPMSGIASAFQLPANLRNVWFTLSFKNDARIVKESVRLHKALVADMLKIVPAEDLAVLIFWQPIPRFFADISISKGGNVLGLDEVDGNSLLWLIAASVKTPEHESILHRKAAVMTAELKKYAESIGAMIPWIYVSYADPSQKALESYGEKNVQFMKKVAAKYDPHGVFQKMVPGSFRLSRIEMGD